MENEITLTDLYANWLYDRAEDLRDIAAALEAEAERFFVLDGESPIESDQQLEAMKKARIKVMIRQIAPEIEPAGN